MSDTIHPLLATFLGGVLRQAIAGVGVWFITQGWFTEAEWANYAAAFVLWAVSLLWMYWVKYGDRLVRLIGLSSAVPMSENQARTFAKIAQAAGDAPKMNTAKDEIPAAPQVLLTDLPAPQTLAERRRP